MKKTFILLLSSILFVSCSTSFAAEIKPFSKVDFNSLSTRKNPPVTKPVESKIVKKKPIAAAVKVPTVIAAKPVEKKIIKTPSNRTSGSYAEVDFLSTKTTYLVSYYKNSSQTWIPTPPENVDTNYGLGMSYKYAVNFNRFFVAPGIFFEQNQFGGAVAQGREGVKFRTQNHYGIKSDFGYDLTNTVAPYFVLGYGRMSYKNRSGGYDSNDEIFYRDRSGHTNNWVYGAGLKIKIEENLAFNLEYTRQRFSVAGNTPFQADYLSASNFEGHLDVLKFGISRNF